MTHDGAELLILEKAKIKSAVLTDFILSIEIVMIALGTVMDQALMLQVVVVSVIAMMATVGVYGFVALLVRMDDTGFYLITLSGQWQGIVARILRGIGSILVAALPQVIRILGIIGTVAMLLVGGGMFTHNIESLHHAVGDMAPLLANLLIGMGVGGLLLAVRLGVKKMLVMEKKE